jgi:hypothetical protein
VSASGDTTLTAGWIGRYTPKGVGAGGREAAILDVAQDLLLGELHDVGALNALVFKRPHRAAQGPRRQPGQILPPPGIQPRGADDLADPPADPGTQDRRGVCNDICDPRFVPAPRAHPGYFLDRVRSATRKTVVRFAAKHALLELDPDGRMPRPSGVTRINRRRGGA